VSEAESIPFYDADGEHHITVQIEYDDTGEPPPVAELIGPAQDGKIMHVYYQRARRGRTGRPAGHRRRPRRNPAALRRCCGCSAPRNGRPER